jgi:endoglucanase
MFDLVKTLTELPGPIGHEDPVNDFLLARWGDRVQRCWSSSVGNLYAHVGGSGRRVLIGGHADEICFMIRSIDPGGFLHLAIWNADREGRPPRWLFPIGQPARIVGPNIAINGVFATATGHVISQEQREKPRLDWDDIFVDIGATSADEVSALGVRVGHRVIWNPPTQRIGRSQFTGKAMDNRCALAIMTALLEELDPSSLNCELYFVSTVLEETGLEGAHSVVRDLGAIDEAIALDVGLSGDIPSISLLDIPVRLGDGPVLVHKDSEIHYSRRVIDRLIATAGSHEIPIQHAIFQNYASDGAAFIRQGIPTALIAFPARYTHSPFETVDESDLLQNVRLLKAYVTTSAGQLP